MINPLGRTLVGLALAGALWSGCTSEPAGPAASSSPACDLLTADDLRTVFGDGVVQVPESAATSWSGQEVATCVFRRTGPAPVVVLASLRRAGNRPADARRAFVEATRASAPDREIDLVDDFLVPAIWDRTLEQLTAFPAGAEVSIKATEAGARTRLDVARALMERALTRLPGAPQA